MDQKFAYSQEQTLPKFLRANAACRAKHRGEYFIKYDLVWLRDTVDVYARLNRGGPVEWNEVVAKFSESRNC